MDRMMTTQGYGHQASEQGGDDRPPDDRKTFGGPDRHYLEKAAEPRCKVWKQQPKYVGKCITCLSSDHSWRECEGDCHHCATLEVEPQPPHPGRFCPEHPGPYRRNDPEFEEAPGYGRKREDMAREVREDTSRRTRRQRTEQSVLPPPAPNAEADALREELRQARDQLQDVKQGFGILENLVADLQGRLGRYERGDEMVLDGGNMEIARPHPPSPPPSRAEVPGSLLSRLTPAPPQPRHGLAERQSFDDCWQCWRPGHKREQCNNPVKCYHCGEKGHDRDECPRLECLRCGSAAHVLKHCDQEGEDPDRCRLCHLLGHWARDCLNKKNKRNKQKKPEGEE